jgi:L-arabinose isomerase
MESKRIERRNPLQAHVGVFGVGFWKYWDQFDGLLEEMIDKQNKFINKLEKLDVQVHDFGMVDDAESTYALVPKLKAANLDLIFCDMLTYATSSTFGAIIRNMDVPIVMVALQPRMALDYTRASTHMQLANDDFCSVPEFAGVAVRMGKRVPEVIIGTLEGDTEADEEIARFCRIAHVLHDLKKARIGHFGHPIESMLDMHTDPTMLTAAFGCHIVQTEAEDILKQYYLVQDVDIEKQKHSILDFFDTPNPVSDPVTKKLTDEDLNTAAKVSLALEKFVEENNLDGLAYYYDALEGSDLRTVVTNLIIGNSLLTSAGFPLCGESDLKTCIAMLIMDRLEIGGSFAEFHPIDFKEGFVLVGHDGPHHINIADSRPVLRSLIKYHGKPGSGASVEFKIKEGPITMLSISSTYDGKFKFVIAEGESVAGPIPPTGNTNTRAYFKPDIRTFLKRWVADYLGIQAVIIDQ